MPERRKRFVIIDGKSVFYRGFYAMPYLSTKQGVATGGVYGFAVMALEVIRKLNPDYVCVAWDKPKTNIRKRLAMYPQYKAGRKPAPPEFYAQIPLLHELLNAFGWPLYELDDYEADDIMGALALQAKKKDIETFLVTSDLDVLQLVDSHTHAYLLKKGLSSIEEYTPTSFEEKYGIQADQFLDYKALAGDSSDNIPGVPGIGSKTAIELLKKYKDLDDIYSNVDLVKGSISSKLVAGKDSAFLSKKLAQIWVDAPIKLDIAAVDGSKTDPEKIKEKLTEFEFRSLVSRLPETFKAISVPESSASKSQLDKPKVTIVENDADLEKLNIKVTQELLIHGRAAGSHGMKPKILILSTETNKVYVLKVHGLNLKLIQTKLAALLTSNKVAKIGYNIKYSIELCYSLGLDIEHVGHDVMVASFILDPLNKGLSLTELANSDLGYEGSSLDNLDDEELINLSGDIIWAIREIAKVQQARLKDLPKLHKLAQEIEWPVIPVLASMEYVGIKLDTKYLNKMSAVLAKQISTIEAQIYKLSGSEFNINSPSQLSDILFKKMNIPSIGISKTKTSFSTASKELDKLRGSHPIIDQITEYRELTKLKSTYVDALPLQVDERSRLHTSFNLTVAQTGRLSSTDPNLQNIPVRTDVGRQIRTAFVADEGNVLISADYSQFELRLAACLADDKELIDEFNHDADIHSITAAQIFGRSSEDVTQQMRRTAKAINFGILYGMSPHGLSVAANISPAAAKAFIDRYYELRKPIIEYMEKVRRDTRKHGYAEDLFGRRRPFPDINSANFVIRQAAERAAINMPIQGAEAELMKMSMVAAANLLKGSDCKILLQIHDSVLVECPASKAKKVEALLVNTMETIYPLPVKLTVDTKIGKNWGEL